MVAPRRSSLSSHSWLYPSNVSILWQKLVYHIFIPRVIIDIPQVIISIKCKHFETKTMALHLTIYFQIHQKSVFDHNNTQTSYLSWLIFMFGSSKSLQEGEFDGSKIESIELTQQQTSKLMSRNLDQFSFQWLSTLEETMSCAGPSRWKQWFGFILKSEDGNVYLKFPCRPWSSW